MPTPETPGVKHITLTCPVVKCKSQAFVQVIVVEDQELQKRIDARADQKLRETLDEEHREGLHD